jgi:hypothetical protein
MQTRDHDPQHQACDCRGGSREVTEVFARQEAGIPDGADLETWAHAPANTPERDAYAKLVGMRNTVYPCPQCNAEQFKRWRNGCFRPNHAAKSCRLCTPERGR